MNGIATLGKDENFSVFSFADKTIRFRAPYSLEGYTAVKQWDHGYLVVMAKYCHNHEPEEEYIDLLPILEDLYIDPKTFLDPITEVRIVHA